MNIPDFDEKPKRKRTLPTRPNWLKMGCVSLAVVAAATLFLCAAATFAVANVVSSFVSVPFLEGDGFPFEYDD